jgi:hypothetical protein
VCPISEGHFWRHGVSDNLTWLGVTYKLELCDRGTCVEHRRPLTRMEPRPRSVTSVGMFASQPGDNSWLDRQGDNLSGQNREIIVWVFADAMMLCPIVYFGFVYYRRKHFCSRTKDIVKGGVVDSGVGSFILTCFEDFDEVLATPS